MNITAPSHSPLETNAYGRSLERQIRFLRFLQQGICPDSSDLYDWQEKTNPKNNGLNAWINFSKQKMYHTFKEEEKSFLEEISGKTLQKCKQAKYIVDYACGDSSTTIHVLDHCITSGKITKEELQEKEFIVYDSNPQAVAIAKKNMTEFLRKIGCHQPRVHALVENRNDVQQPHHILDKYAGDTFIFATGFTVGNLSDTGKHAFCNFDPSYKHTLLTTYFTKPTPQREPYIQAVYGKETEATTISSSAISQQDIDDMRGAAAHQINQLLYAAGRSEHEVNLTEITNIYDKNTGEIPVGFILRETITKEIGEETYTLKPGFYPIYTSQRFGEDTPPLDEKLSESKRGTFVGYDVYDLKHNNKKLKMAGITAGAALLLLSVLLIFSQQNKKTTQQYEKNKQKAILELVNKSLTAHERERELNQTDSFKVDLFFQRCTSVGNILNELFDTKEFTGSGAYTESMENFLIQELATIDQISFFQSVDRYVENLQEAHIQLAVAFIKKHPLILANLDTSRLEILRRHTEALQNTLSLSPEKAEELQNRILGTTVNVLFPTPVWGRETRPIYTLGLVSYEEKMYVVSVPTPLLQTMQQKDIESGPGIVGPITLPITQYVVDNGLGSFQLDISVARCVARLLETLP